MLMGMVDEVLETHRRITQLKVAAALRADDAVSDRVAQTERTAHRQDEIADLYPLAVSQRCGDQIGC